MVQKAWTPTKRRGPIAAEFSSPGPACVTLPTLIGKTVVDSKKYRAPSFSFGVRYEGKNYNVGPGPGQYNVTGLSCKGRDTAPAASLHSKPKDRTIVKTPAPGDYNYETSSKKIFDNSPKYTFGIKTTFEKPNPTPAPNAYKMPSVLGETREGNKSSAPAFSLSGRAKILTDDRIHVPGPGTYNVMPEATLPKPPSYSVSSRTSIPRGYESNPGPGTYAPEKQLSINLGYSPSYTFGIRHSNFSGIVCIKEINETQKAVFNFLSKH